MSRKCTKCGVIKDISFFRLRKANSTSFRSWCRECVNEETVKWKKAHPAAALQTEEKNRKKRHKAIRESYYKKEYGIDFEDWARMYEAQNGKCLGCDKKLSLSNERSGAPHVDHEHVTGFVRGILCGPCNLALGGAKDDPSVLRRLADYLEEKAPSPLFYSDQLRGCRWDQDWEHDRVADD